MSKETSAARAASTTPARKGWKFVVRDIAIILLIAILASFLIKTFLVRSFYIPSASMENTLMINDRVLVNELEPTVIPISRGDVIVFTDPGGWLTRDHVVPKPPPSPVSGALSFLGLTSADENNHLVKRVIGLPGDTVACCNTLGQMTINGAPVKEPYLQSPDQPASATQFKITVPAHSLWVMGDNRNNSGDSRAHRGGPTKGFVPVSDVVGRAFVINWPINRWAWLDNFPIVYSAVSKQ
jgi:signal peptidase I